MTPFDPVALLAMLLTFYPNVSPAELARAHRERPDYFGGGQIIGLTGSHLELPDGRVYDLIFAVDGPEPSRWQTLLVTPGAGDDDPFPLAPGPLTPIDPSIIPPPRTDLPFTPLVAGYRAELDALETAIGAREFVIAAHADPTGIDGEFDALIPPARQAIDGEIAALYTLEPGDELAAIDGHDAVIIAEAGELPPEEGAPGELPGYDPGPIPPEEEPPQPEI